jgi:hypothetical protein
MGANPVNRCVSYTQFAINSRQKQTIPEEVQEKNSHLTGPLIDKRKNGDKR